MISFIRKFYFSYLIYLGLLLMPYFNPEMLSSKTRITAWIAALVFASPFVILPIWGYFFKKKQVEK